MTKDEALKRAFELEESQQKQRQWQGLTDEERESLVYQSLRFYDSTASLLSLTKTIEAKLKEKNQ